MLLKIFKALRPDQFSTSAHSDVVANFDATGWDAFDLTDFCLDQISYYASTAPKFSLLWSIFMTYAAGQGARAWTTEDAEGDQLVAVAFPTTVDDGEGNTVTTWEALVFDEEEQSVTPTPPEEVEIINSLIASALAG